MRRDSTSWTDQISKGSTYYGYCSSHFNEAYSWSAFSPLIRILGPRSDPDQYFSSCASSVFGKYAFQSLTLRPHWFSRWNVVDSSWTRSGTNWPTMVSQAFFRCLLKACSSWNWQMIHWCGFSISRSLAKLVVRVLSHITWFWLWIFFSRVFLDCRTAEGCLRSFELEPPRCCYGSHGSFDLGPKKRRAGASLLGRIPWTPFYWDINGSCHGLCSPSPG